MISSVQFPSDSIAVDALFSLNCSDEISINMRKRIAQNGKNTLRCPQRVDNFTICI